MRRRRRSKVLLAATGIAVSLALGPSYVIVLVGTPAFWADVAKFLFRRWKGRWLFSFLGWNGNINGALNLLVVLVGPD